MSHRSLSVTDILFLPISCLSDNSSSYKLDSIKEMKRFPLKLIIQTSVASQKKSISKSAFLNSIQILTIFLSYKAVRQNILERINGSENLISSNLFKPAMRIKKKLLIYTRWTSLFPTACYTGSTEVVNSFSLPCSNEN